MKTAPAPLLSDAAAAARGRDLCRRDEPLPFDTFVTRLGLDSHETQRFYDYVSGAGGGKYTDHATLGTLYDIWKSPGRHG